MTDLVVEHLNLLVLLAGLACWTSLAAFNNLRAFHHGTLYVGFIMGMSALNIPDAPDHPLTVRAVRSKALHKLAFGVIILVEVVVAALLWAALAQLAMSGPVLAGQTALAALTGFMGLAFLLLVSGSWFAYYAHMEQAQLTHFVMILVALAGTIAI